MMHVFAVALAAANLLPNPSFEEGEGIPRGWIPGSPEAIFVRDAARTGSRSIAVRTAKRGTSLWRSEEIAVSAGTYRLSFWARQAPGTAGGCIVSGPEFMNRDFQAGEEWTLRSFVFPVPEGRGSLAIRLGVWEKAGEVAFDDASLVRCIPIHRRAGERVLGAGESVAGRRYLFAPDLGGEGSGYARPLAAWTCGFNSNRWTFSPGESLVYRHEIGSASQTAARLSVSIGYHAAGGCIVEASPDGTTWARAGELGGLGSKTFPLPSSLFPARAVFVRLRSPARAEDGVAPGSFQVYALRYEADLDADLGSAEGETRFIEVEEDGFAAGLEIADLGDLIPGGRNRILARILRPDPAAAAAWEAMVSPGGSARRGTAADPGSAIEIPYEVPDRGEYELAFAIAAGGRAFRGRLPFSVPALHATDYGEALAADERAAWWWCEGGFKVSRTRPAPPLRGSGGPARIRVAAARGEMESFQLVVRPNRRLEGVRIAVRPRGADPAPEVYEIAEVAYLEVEVPTDAAGCRGAWPDPLARLAGPIAMEPGTNRPIWITLRIPRGIRPGEHEMAVEVAEEGRTIASFPLAVRVFDYEIPRERHLATAFGLSAGEIHRYHNLSREEDRRAVWDLYMQNFRDHRVSPYTFAPYDPIRLRFEGEERVPRVEFAAWDAQASRYLDGFGFDSFLLPLEGLGGGTFHSRREGEFGGERQGTPAYRRLFGLYARAIQNHLEAKGWLRKAYVYWFDEPEEKDYAFVRAGMEEIRLAAPKIRRMLTEEPQPALFGAVDIWCPILHAASPEAIRERLAAGEDVWWYICTGPKAPYPGLFIDHDGIELRIWLWMTWKYGVRGILVWQSNYWTSPCAYPNEPQNPWEDPMGYVSGYGNPPGYIGYWGNGDGRFLYPPNRDVRNDRRPHLEGPMNSIRWEMLREGIEDYEMFVLLRDRIAGARRAGVPESELRAAEALLEIPESIVRDRTRFTKDPRDLDRYRARVAEAIERLAPTPARSGGSPGRP